MRTYLRASLLTAIVATVGCGNSTPSVDGAAVVGDMSMSPGDGASPGGHDLTMPLSGANLPLVTPPVRAAAPAGFGGGAGTASLDPMDIKSRFFGMGPTYVFAILQTIDAQIMGVNMHGPSACLTATPTPYNLTPFGQTVPFYAQCYEQPSVGMMTGDAGASTGLFQFGQKDGVTYLYFSAGVEWTAAIVTPIFVNGAGDGGATDDAGTDAGAVDGGVTPQYSVQVWMGVGYTNATSCGNMDGFDDCSYGVIQLNANTLAQTFEMTVAGVGFGYCGAQLKSDGVSVYAIGSTDMGQTCNANDTLCVAASDVTTPATCDSSLMSFALPPLGRLAGSGSSRGAFGASQYPGGSGNQIVLDGTSDDSLRFGPTTPTSGVASF